MSALYVGSISVMLDSGYRQCLVEASKADSRVVYGNKR